MLRQSFCNALLCAALSLSAAAIARGEDITRGGKPAELTVTQSGDHSVRVMLAPPDTALPASPSLVDHTYPKAAISLREITAPVSASVGTLKVSVSPAPLTVKVSDAAGKEIQELVFDPNGSVGFKVGDAPVLGMGEGGQQGLSGRGPQFDRRGSFDPMAPGWGSGTLGSRNPTALLVGTDGWGIFVPSPWVQVDLRDKSKGSFIPTLNSRATAGARGNPPAAGRRGNAATSSTITQMIQAPGRGPTEPPGSAATSATLARGRGRGRGGRARGANAATTGTQAQVAGGAAVQGNTPATNANAAPTGARGGQAGGRGAAPINTTPDPAAAALPFVAFVFDAREPANMMKDIRDLTGPAAMPPMWALGYMQSHRELRDDKLSPQELILAEVKKFRDKKLPVDAMIYLGTGFTPTGWNTKQPSFTFNPDVFTDNPKNVIDKMHAEHVKVILHIVDPAPRDMPNIQGSIPAKPGEPLDATHIQNYWAEHKPLLDAGADGFWPDEGDRFSIAERMTREKMYYQGGLASHPDERPWTINRNGVVGMAQWGAWMWSGDTQAQWNTLRDQIWIGQNVGLSITPYWGSDTGGFYTTNQFSAEMYTRWFQFSAFCGSFRSHGRIWRLHTPYGWGESEVGFLEGQNAYPKPEEMNNAAIEPITKKYDELHYQLLPYTYTLAREAYDTGLPLMRALWLHYPSDKEAVAQSQEYLWGRDMLVAPIYEQGATKRDVYLPQGEWYDWWTNEKQSGGKNVSKAVDLATMPLYVRAGAIIPFDPIRQYAEEKVDGPTTLRVYPGADGTFTMYADDGKTEAYKENKGTWTKMTWHDGTKTLTIEPSAPQGITNATTGARTFKVQTPDGKSQTAEYKGQKLDVKIM